MIPLSPANPLSQNTEPERRRLDRRVLFFPMLCVQIYLTGTVLLFAFGPWPWPVPDKFQLYAFLFFAQCALFLSYVTTRQTAPTRYIGRLSWGKLFTLTLVLNMVWIIPNFMERLGVKAFNFSTVLAKVVMGFSDPGAMYKQKIGAMGALDSTPFLAFVTLLLVLLTPIAVVYWKRLSALQKSLTIAIICVDMLSWIASGSNRGLADLLLQLPWLIAAGTPILIKRINMRHVIFTGVVFLVALAAIMTFFSIGQLGRAGGKKYPSTIIPPTSAPIRTIFSCAICPPNPAASSLRWPAT